MSSCRWCSSRQRVGHELPCSAKVDREPLNKLIFLKGHDFSRAAIVIESVWALAPEGIFPVQ
jgi:hypothetical protein